MNVRQFSQLFRDLAEQEKKEGVSDEMIERFIDRQCSESERRTMEIEMAKNANLRRRVAEAEAMFQRLSHPQGPASSASLGKSIVAIAENALVHATRISEGLREIAAAFYSPLNPTHFKGDIKDYPSKNQAASYMILSNEEGGRTFLLTSLRPEDAGVEVEFFLDQGECTWSRRLVLERPYADAKRIEAKLTVSFGELAALGGKGEIRVKFVEP